MSARDVLATEYNGPEADFIIALLSAAGYAVMPVAWAPTHQHVKSGGLYRVLMRGEMEADLSAAVIYDNADGRVWIRSAIEFDDGRFAMIAASEPTR